MTGAGVSSKGSQCREGLLPSSHTWLWAGPGPPPRGALPGSLTAQQPSWRKRRSAQEECHAVYNRISELRPAALHVFFWSEVGLAHCRVTHSPRCPEVGCPGPLLAAHTHRGTTQGPGLGPRVTSQLL